MKNKRYGDIIAINQALYLDYINDFLSVKGFANYHMIPVKSAMRIIIKGRTLHNSQFGSVL